MGTRFDARASDRVVLPLERTRRVDDDVRAEPSQLRCKIRCASIEQRSLCGTADLIRNRARLLQIAARNDDAAAPVGRQ